MPRTTAVGIVSGAHLLEQTIYLIESGLSSSSSCSRVTFRLSWTGPLLESLLGLGISACVASRLLGGHRQCGLLDIDAISFSISSTWRTYHVCVLIWFYYLLVPRESSYARPAVPLPENNLDVWNRELERLVHQ